MLLFYRYCFVIKAYYINTLYYVAIKGNTWYMYIYIYQTFSAVSFCASPALVAFAGASGTFSLGAFGIAPNGFSSGAAGKGSSLK
jgi:hypothetical protein